MLISLNLSSVKDFDIWSYEPSQIINAHILIESIPLSQQISLLGQNKIDQASIIFLETDGR